MAQTTPKEPKPSLLTIPAELRSRIYEEVFTLPIYPMHNSTAKAARFYSNRTRINTVLRLLDTCRQIHNEAKAIYEHINPSFFGRSWALIDFFQSPSAVRAPYMRSLTLIPHPEPPRSFAWLGINIVASQIHAPEGPLYLGISPCHLGVRAPDPESSGALARLGGVSDYLH